MDSVYRLELVRENEASRTVSVGADETILAAAERQGIPLPFGCRRGYCGTCTGRLIEGEVAYEQPPRALNSTRSREGYALLCIARPRSDGRIEVGTRLLSDMIRNPFRTPSPEPGPDDPSGPGEDPPA